MKDKKQKGWKWKVFKKLFLYAGLPFFIFLLIYGWYFTYNLPETVTQRIKEELDKYNIGPYSIEAISVRHNKAVLGPISFGEGEDTLKLSKVQLNYTFQGIRHGEIESVLISGADLHLNRRGEWSLAGLEGVLRGIANYQKANPSTSKSSLPRIKVETSLLTLHYLGRQYSFPLSMLISEKDEKIVFEVQTNLSRDKLQTFNFELKRDTLALEFKLDSFRLDLAQAGHFLQRFGMKDSKGSISASDIRMSYSSEKFDFGAKIQIQNFKTIYKDEDKPATLTFDELEAVTISRNLKDNKDIFKDTIHFHNFAYSYGTYLFNAGKIKSKVHFDLDANIYKTDSLLTEVSAQIDGSTLNSLSDIELKLNWDKGDLQTYSTKGMLDLSYSRGFIQGQADINVAGTQETLDVSGTFKNLKIPDGSIQNGSFIYKQAGSLLNVDVKANDFTVLGGSFKGNTAFSYKKENSLVNISGSLKDLKIFERFTGNGEVSLIESEKGLDASIKNFSFKTAQDSFNLALDAAVNIPLSFDDFINKALKSDFSVSSSVRHFKVGDSVLKPFSFTLAAKENLLNFSADSFESADFPSVKIGAVSGTMDLNKRQAGLSFQTFIDWGNKIPGLEGKPEPVNFSVNITETEGVLDLQVSNELPESTFSFKNSDLSFNTSIKHQNLLKAEIPLSNFLKSRITSLKGKVNVLFKNLKTNQLEVEEAATELQISCDEAVGLENYLELLLKGRLTNTVSSLKLGLKKASEKEMAEMDIPLWKEGLQLKNLSTSLPFEWSMRRGFENTAQSIKLASLSHFRWVDGGEFLGWFAKEVSLQNLKLDGAVKGLQMEVDEDIRLNDRLSVHLKLNSGWEIPEEILSAKKSPLVFLSRLILVPEHEFKSSASLTVSDAEITDLAEFIKEPVSEDNILKGKVSAKLSFQKDSKGVKSPAVIELKNIRAYFSGKNDFFVKIKGLRGKLKFASLLDLNSEDSQYLRMDSFEAPGLKLSDTLVKYKIYSPEKIRIMRLNTTWCSGKIEGADILFNPAHQSLNCTIYASKVQMEELMELMKGVECKANGTLYGRLNLEVRNGKVMNQNGFLFSEPGTKMSLQMNSENIIYDSITNEKTRKILSDLNVEYFKILFQGGEDINKHKIVFNLKGASALGDPPNPLDLSINFNGPVIYYLQLPLHEKGIKDFIENKSKEKK